MSEAFVYLASRSPRRQELLTQIGVPFQVLDASIDEAVAAGEAPETYVTRLARAKAVAGRELSEGAALPTAPVLAADTAVSLDGSILVKPTDRGDALCMLRRLSGRTHEVWTAVALALPDRVESRVSRSAVSFRAVTAAEARDYWETGEPGDKAGAYAIQGCAAVFIRDLHGSYSGVMGLPLYETAELLDLAGVPRWRGGYRP